MEWNDERERKCKMRVSTLKFLSQLTCVSSLLGHLDESTSREGQYVPILQLLETECFTAVSTALLSRIARYFPDKLTNRILSALAPPSLKELDLTACTGISVMGLAGIFKKCPSLQSLTLTDCSHLVVPDIFVLASLTGGKVGRGLTTVVMEGNSSVTNEVVHVMLNNLPNLTSINLSCCQEIDDSVFLLHPDLQTSLETCKMPVVKTDYQSRLTSVDISSCSRLTGDAVLHLTSLCGPSLRHVNIASAGMTPEVLLYLAGYNLPSVVSLMCSVGNSFQLTESTADDTASTGSESAVCHCAPAEAEDKPVLSHDDVHVLLPGDEKHALDSCHGKQLDPTEGCANCLSGEPKDCCHGDCGSSQGHSKIPLDTGCVVTTSADVCESSQSSQVIHVSNCDRDSPESLDCDTEGCNKTGGSADTGQLQEIQGDMLPSSVTKPASKTDDSGEKLDGLSYSDTTPARSQQEADINISPQLLPATAGSDSGGRVLLAPAVDPSTPESDSAREDIGRARQTQGVAEKCDACGREKQFVKTQIYTPNLLSLNITGIGFPSKDLGVGKLCLGVFFTSNPGLHKLDMNWKFLSPELMQFIAKKARDLTEVSVEECTWLQNEGVARLGQHCRKLRKVNLRGVVFFRDSGMVPFLSLPNLEGLSLAESEVTDATLARLATRCGDKLKEIDLSWCEEITEKGVNIICTKCTSLEVLQLRKCPLSSLTLHLLAKHSHSLREMNMESVDGLGEDLTDSAVMTLAENLPCLERVDLSWNLSLTDASICKLFQCCSQLQEAYLKGLKLITSEPFLPIIADLKKWRRSQALLKYKKLEQMKLAAMKEEQYSSDEEYADLHIPHRSTTYVPNLRVLELEYSDRVTDEHLAEIVTVCRGSLKIKDYYCQVVEPQLLKFHAGDMRYMHV